MTPPTWLDAHGGRRPTHAHVISTLAVLTTLISGCPAHTPPFPRTDVPLKGVKLGEVLLTDNFDDPTAGHLPQRTAHPNIEEGYRAGEYFISLSSSYVTKNWAVGPDHVFANVQVAADARLAGVTDTRWVGLMCRLRVSGREVTGYVLALSPTTGRVALERRDPNGFVKLVPSAASAHVRRGNATNHLELTCAGSRIEAHVNGGQVASAEDSTSSSGYVTFIAGRDTQVPVLAWFDNLTVTEVRAEP